MYPENLTQADGAVAAPCDDRAEPASRMTAATPADATGNRTAGGNLHHAKGAAATPLHRPSLHSPVARPDGDSHAATGQAAGTGTAPPRSTSTGVPARELALFMTRMRELLDATDEAERRRLEDEVLDLSIPLQAAGMFEILDITHAALAAMVRDHLAESTPVHDTSARLHGQEPPTPSLPAAPARNESADRGT